MRITTGKPPEVFPDLPFKHETQNGEGVAWHGVRGHVCKRSINAIYGRDQIRQSSCIFVPNTQTNATNKQTNRVHVSISWLRSTQVFIPCTRGGGWGGGGGFTGGALKVSNFHLLFVSCTCSPGCAPLPANHAFFPLFFFSKFCCRAGGSETKGLGLGAETVPLLGEKKNPLFKVNLHEFSVLPSIVKEKVC